MSNEQIKSAINRVRQAHSRLSVGINNAIKGGVESSPIRVEQTPVGDFTNLRPQGQATATARGKVSRENGRQDSLRSSRIDTSSGQRGQVVSLNKPLGRPFQSAALAQAGALPQPGARLFKEDSHELDPPVAVAASVNSMPSFSPHAETAVQTKYGPGIRYSGTEFLTSVSTSSTAGSNPAPGELLYSMPISPHTIPDTRLSLASQMYTRYIFKKLKFYYLPTAPSTTAGSVLMFCDYDPSQNPLVTGVGDGVLRYSFAHKASESSVWQRQACEITDNVYADMLYNDPDAELRWSVQGCFWLISTGTLPVNTELGKIVLEYEIDFACADYRGSINVTPVTRTTFTFNTKAVANAVDGTFGAAPPPGVYFMRFENFTTGGSVTVNANYNAYAQGAPTFPLQKGAGVFVIQQVAAQSAILLLTPDFYGEQNLQNSALVAASAIGAGAQVANVVLYPIERVTND